MIATRLEGNLSTNKLHDDLQSALREDHSTETAFLKVHHDIAEALHQKCMAALVLLDLSAAFHIIDHRILQVRLEYSYGVTGSALSWKKIILE